MWVFIAVLAAVLTCAAAPAGVEGTWLGTLEAGSVKLRIGVHLLRDTAGKLNGTLDSIDQGARGLAIGTASLEGDLLRFDVPVVAGTYEGTVAPDGSVIDGVWKQGANSLKLVLRRVSQLPGSNRPQEPKPPFPYAEEQVTYENSEADIKLAGTLTLPRTGGPHPAVLLITGSGPQNRDEALAGHRPFFILADYLTRHGIAVLRVDDRGVGGSTGNTLESTSEDFAGDVLAGVAFLKSRKEIDPKRIGLVGHSEGGLIAPMVAARSRDVAFIVLMAGPGVNGEKVIRLQGELIGKAMGVSPQFAALNSELVGAALAILRSEKDNAAAQTKIKEEVARRLDALPPDRREAAKPLMAAMNAEMRFMTTKWFRAFITYEPRSFLSKVAVPVLAMNGSLDLQVPPVQNLPAIAEALEAGGNRDYAIVKLPGLNHLFQTAKTGSPAEYGQIEETIAPLALETMGDWISRHAK